MIEVDLSRSSVRALNERLHRLTPHTNELYWRVLNPNGAHAIAVGITQPVRVEIKGHVGYYCAGMNTAATVVVNGHAGTGLAENIMSGLVRVRGNASQSAAEWPHHRAMEGYVRWHYAPVHVDDDASKYFKPRIHPDGLESSKPDLPGHRYKSVALFPRSRNAKRCSAPGIPGWNHHH